MISLRKVELVFKMLHTLMRGKDYAKEENKHMSRQGSWSLSALRFSRLGNTKFIGGTPGCFVCSGSIQETSDDTTGFRTRVEALLAEPKKAATVCHLCTTYLERAAPRVTEICRYAVCPHEETIAKIGRTDVPHGEAGGYGELVVQVSHKTALQMGKHAAGMLREQNGTKRRSGKKHQRDADDGMSVAGDNDGDEPEPMLPETRGKSAAPMNRSTKVAASDATTAALTAQ